MVDKREYYPTPEEVANFVNKNSHRLFEELLVLLGVDEDYLEEIIIEKKLKMKDVDEQPLQ